MCGFMKNLKTKMPVLFVGHGNPMNAIEDNEFSRSWIKAAKSLPKPRAILCISAHWETDDSTCVTAMEHPKMIYDFYGFPKPLYEKKYPAHGSPELAASLQKIVRKAHVQSDFDWGLDHGTWAVLCRMFPKADVPVVQLSLNRKEGAEFHYKLGQELKGLRREGVLIIGSGNMVHNLGRMSWEDAAFDWALKFDEQLKQLILSGDHASIINYKSLGSAADLSIPTNEHYLPLLYVLALQEKDDSITFFAEKITLGSISMRSVRIG
ncbi:MAG: 4,5-DOPA dioxygenase extradiol [Candidatus Omnitrophica bacterium]|nr:4,5-DOPA dioxygenase extradiol [Candidatus Omnitrophota bacterium]